MTNPTFAIAYQNEGNEHVSLLVTDLSGMVLEQQQYNLSGDHMHGRMVGMEQTLNMIMCAYNLVPKGTPLSQDAFEALQKTAVEYRESVKAKGVADALDELAAADARNNPTSINHGPDAPIGPSSEATIQEGSEYILRT